MSDTSARRCRTPEPMEYACVLCGRAEADPDICGPKLHHQGIYAHQFCLLFANELSREHTEEEAEMRFYREDIQQTVEQAAQMVCFVCGKRGATITCRETGCSRRFHLPCAVEGQCVTCYLPPFRSFCQEHSPQQEEEVAPEGTACLICLEPVEGRTTYGTMVCPACKHAWFHRACMQGQALSSGILCLQCPLCRNQNWFLLEMVHMGIQIPIRPLSWENNNAYAELYERHRSCDARECLCPGGRGVAEPDGFWQLLLCCSCAALGTHRRCSNLRNSSEARWECDSCAGLSTSSSASSELAGPSTAGPAALRQSSGSLELESSLASTSSQAASGQTLGPPGQETSSRQMPSLPCRVSPVCEGRSCSSPPGPCRRQHQTQANRRAQTPYTWPRGQWEESQLPTTCTASSSRSQAVSGLSQRSPVIACSGSMTDSQESPASRSSSTDNQESWGTSCDSPEWESSSSGTDSLEAL